MKRVVQLVVAEGALEIPVAKRLLKEVGIDFSSAHFIDKGGRTRFWPSLQKLHAACASIGTIFALGDLEGERCAPALIKKHVKEPLHRAFVVRIAERMLEAWLLADAERIAAFLNAPVAKIPAQPDREHQPKRVIVNLARQYGTRALVEDLVPEAGLSGIVGPGYTLRMHDFIERSWRPTAAQNRSPSLARALRALARLQDS